MIWLAYLVILVIIALAIPPRYDPAIRLKEWVLRNKEKRHEPR